MVIIKASPLSNLIVNNDSNNIPRLALSVREACKSIDISRAKLYMLMKAGQLGWVSIGSRRVIPITELEALLARGSKGG